MSWEIKGCHAKDETGTSYWVGNGFIFFRAENRPIQLPPLKRYKKWREFKKEALKQLTTPNKDSKLIDGEKK